jgi:hypothetical protein
MHKFGVHFAVLECQHAERPYLLLTLLCCCRWILVGPITLCPSEQYYT